MLKKLLIFGALINLAGLKHNYAIGDWTNSVGAINYTSGNVGIGVNNPSQDLNHQLVVQVSTEDKYAFQALSANGTNAGGLWVGSGGGSDLYLKAANGDPGTFLVGGGDSYFAGNVGVGIVSPAYKLDVAGTIRTNTLYFPETSNNDDILFGSTFRLRSAANNNYVLDHPKDTGHIFIRSFEAGDTSGDLVLNDLCGNVGIGTASPAYKLDVLGTTKTSSLYFPETSNNDDILFGSTFRLRSAANNNYVLDHPKDTGHIFIRSFEAGDTSGDLVLNDLGGNVGVGTATPRSKLDVYTHDPVSTAGQQALMIGAKTSSTAFGSGPVINFVTGEGPNEGTDWLPMAKIHANYYETGKTRLDFWTGWTNDHKVNMTIDHDGKVGIGTETPHTDLHVHAVNDNSTISLTNTYTGKEASDGSYVSVSKFTGGLAIMNKETSGSNPYLSLGTNNEHRLFIKQGGNIGIGTIEPAHKLDVAGTINAENILINGVPITQIVTNASPWHSDGNNVNFSEGNLGLGTSNPSAKLDINGDLKVSQSAQVDGDLIVSQSAQVDGELAVSQSAHVDGDLEVNGYTKLGLTSGYPPPAHCDTFSHYGRMKVDPFTPSLFICSKFGWVRR
ncbi:hypothetical protein MJH12_02330 [bacterium]|nr:hypothetical protein [bacterium]